MPTVFGLMCTASHSALACKYAKRAVRNLGLIFTNCAKNTSAPVIALQENKTKMNYPTYTYIYIEKGVKGNKFAIS